jgi:hypothetical protein
MVNRILSKFTIIIISVKVDNNICPDDVAIFENLRLGFRRPYVQGAYIQLLCGLFYRGSSVGCDYTIPFTSL